MEMITNATCPGLFNKPCGKPTRDYEPTREPVPRCYDCERADRKYWATLNEPKRKRKARR